MSIFVAAVCGILLGMVAGLVPGIGMTTMVMSMYLVLLSFDAGQILIFYFCLLAASQYFGSIPAIFLGVAGESSSNPAVTEGHALARLQQNFSFPIREPIAMIELDCYSSRYVFNAHALHFPI
jgi:TctA family transporter